MTPILGVHIKKGPIFFLSPHRMILFQRDLTPNAPYFHSPLGTSTSLSYSSAPPPPHAGGSNDSSPSPRNDVEYQHWVATLRSSYALSDLSKMRGRQRRLKSGTTDLYTLDRKRPLRLWSHPAAIFLCWMYPKRSVHPTRAYYIIQYFDGNRSKEPIKYVFSLFISDNSLLLKSGMRKIINSINKLPGEHARKYFSK